jgi:hypothetical protein
MRHRVVLGSVIAAVVTIMPMVPSAGADLDDVRAERDQTAAELRGLLSEPPPRGRRARR